MQQPIPRTNKEENQLGHDRPTSKCLVYSDRLYRALLDHSGLYQCLLSLRDTTGLYWSLLIVDQLYLTLLFLY